MTFSPASHDQAVGRVDREKCKPITKADWIAEAADLLVKKGGVPSDKAPSMASDIFANTVAFLRGDEAKAARQQRGRSRGQRHVLLGRARGAVIASPAGRLYVPAHPSPSPSCAGGFGDNRENPPPLTKVIICCLTL